MALRVNDVPLPPIFVVDVIKEVARRKRSKPRKVRANITYNQLRCIVENWCAIGSELWKVMIAMAMGIGFCTLLRYSNLCYIHL